MEIYNTTMWNPFKRSHPVVILAYFVALLFFCGTLKHPYLTGILTVSLLMLVFWHVRRPKPMISYLLLWLIIGCSNPLFVYRGDTVLFQIGGMTCTLEALLYGLCNGALLMDMVLLFSLFQRYFGREHWIYLFGNIAPKIGVLFSMSLSFFPKFQKHGKELYEIQKQLFTQSAVRRALKVFNMETTWAFESSVDTLDSMNARGFGIGRRSHFHLFSFERMDGIHLIEVLALFGLNLFLIQTKYHKFYFYPYIAFTPWNMSDFLAILLLGLLVILPFLWRYKHD